MPAIWDSDAVIAATETEYDSLDAVLASLTTLETLFLTRRDRRGAFVSAYIVMTREMKRRVATAGFADPAWVTRYAIAFANLYRTALLRYARGERETTPAVWRLTFDAAAAGHALVIQDLFLGLNAHINRDLPFALTAVGIGPDRASRYADHTAVNAILEATTNAVQSRIAQLYDVALGILDGALGRFDEAVTAFSFVAARENAWDRAVAIANARDDLERGRVVDRLEEHARVLARLIVAPTVPLWTLDALQHLERTRDWTRYLTVPPR